MPRGFSLILVVALGAAVPLGLIGCTSQMETTAPPVDAPEQFSNSGTPEVPDRWWTTFENEQLNALVDSATASNFTLKSAWERLQAAQAVVDRESSGLFPTLDASGRGEVRRSEGTAEPTEALELGLDASYEVDLWGRIRASAEAERFRAQATRAEYQTAALSVSSEVVRTWYQLAAAQSQLRLVNDQIETNETVLELLQNRLETGQIQSVDVLRQRQLVRSTREQRSVVESRAQVLEHQLAVLLGAAPQAGVDPAPDTLPGLPPLPETGVPMDLVQRRPDVRQAFNQLRAADRDLAAAVSNQYPRLTLSASASSAADNAANLFQEWATSFAGNLLAPIFRGGELRAEVDRTESVKQQRLYEYAQTTLTAFQDVEDALVREQKQREQIRELDEQVELGQQAYEQLRLQYLNGTSGYLDVLTALDELQQLRRDLLSARLTLVEDRIALYRALAGSFRTSRESDG